MPSFRLLPFVVVSGTFLFVGTASAQQRLYLGPGYPGVYAGAGVPPAGFGYLSTYGYFNPPYNASLGVRNTGPNAFGPPGGYGYYPNLSSPLGVGPTVVLVPVPVPVERPVPRNNTAITEVTAPDGATVTLNGTPADTLTGVRLFKSPPLSPGKLYSYKAVAKWAENGKPVAREKTVDVQANGRFTVDLTTP
jgi:uncharacterized protein (TIGR03000 family)